MHTHTSLSLSLFLLSFIGQLNGTSVRWRACSLDIGVNFVCKLVQTLWYLDPHHEKFAEKGLHLPDQFVTYKEYNDFKKKKRGALTLCQWFTAAH